MSSRSLGVNLEVRHGPLRRNGYSACKLVSSRRCRQAGLAGVLPAQPQTEMRQKRHRLRADHPLRTAPSPIGSRAAAFAPEAYHQVPDREEREGRLLRNEVDALIAATALGMGYDKPDLGFVVHFHQPASVVHYYQQVGRAGRTIADAYGVMLSGGDDRNINDYFIEQAFPSEEEVVAILGEVEQSAQGLTMAQLEARR